MYIQKRHKFTINYKFFLFINCQEKKTETSDLQKFRKIFYFLELFPIILYF